MPYDVYDLREWQEHELPMYLNTTPIADQPNPPKTRACPDCGGPWKIIAAIVEPAAIQKILTYLGIPDNYPTSPRPIPTLFSFRHSHGGTGSLSTHSPAFSALACCSSSCMVASLGA